MPSDTPIPEHVTGLANNPLGPQNFSFANPQGGTSIVAGDPYTGPVQGLNGEVITLNPSNPQRLGNHAFHLHTCRPGTEAISVANASGTNVLDGGTGSNFLTGGSGNDTFFNDARGCPQPVRLSREPGLSPPMSRNTTSTS